MGPYGMSHDSTSDSYRLGRNPTGSDLGVGYFAFEIPTLDQVIESVKLSVYNPADRTAGDFLLLDQGFENGARPAQITLWDYLGNTSMLESDFSSFLAPPSETSKWEAAAQDLQSGNAYGVTVIDDTSDGMWIEFWLNSDALLDIWNSQGETFALGATSESQAIMFYGEDGPNTGIQDGIHPSARLEFNFRESIALTRAAGVAIPEPSTYGIAGGLVLAVIIALRQTRRKKGPSFPEKD